MSSLLITLIISKKAKPHLLRLGLELAERALLDPPSLSPLLLRLEEASGLEAFLEACRALDTQLGRACMQDKVGQYLRAALSHLPRGSFRLGGPGLPVLSALLSALLEACKAHVCWTGVCLHAGHGESAPQGCTQWSELPWKRNKKGEKHSAWWVDDGRMRQCSNWQMPRLRVAAA